MTIIAEFHQLINLTIPGIVNLLNDDDGDVRLASANALSQLSEQGQTVNLSGSFF
jgi:HEAT repeat